MKDMNAFIIFDEQKNRCIRAFGTLTMAKLKATRECKGRVILWKIKNYMDFYVRDEAAIYVAILMKIDGKWLDASREEMTEEQITRGRQCDDF